MHIYYNKYPFLPHEARVSERFYLSAIVWSGTNNLRIIIKDSSFGKYWIGSLYPILGASIDVLPLDWLNKSVKFHICFASWNHRTTFERNTYLYFFSPKLFSIFLCRRFWNFSINEFFTILLVYTYDRPINDISLLWNKHVWSLCYGIVCDVCGFRVAPHFSSILWDYFCLHGPKMWGPVKIPCRYVTKISYVN